ncbi:MAG: outer membrane beta-barrel protein [Saprospiraceae bacterium]
MKKKFKTKIKLAFVLILFSTYLFSQDPLSFNFQFHQGITGIDLNGEASQFGLFGESTYSVKYGSDLSIGIGFNYFVDEKRKFSFTGSALWNYYSFQRKEESSFTPFGGMTTTHSSWSQYYQAHSILFPMKFNKHSDHLSFTLGVVPRCRLQTRMTIDYTSFILGTPMLTHTTRRYKAGGEYPTFAATADLEYRIDLQYVVGINYHINKELAINIEYRSNLLENNLISKMNVIGEPNAVTISLGVSWKIF